MTTSVSPSNTTDFAALVTGGDVSALGLTVGDDFAPISDVFTATANAKDALSEASRKGGLLPNVAAKGYARMSEEHGVSVDVSLWLTSIAANAYPSPKGDAAAMRVQASLIEYDAAIQAVVMEPIKRAFLAGRDRAHPRTRPMTDDNGAPVLDANGNVQMIGGFSEVIIAWGALGKDKLTGEQFKELESARQVYRNMQSIVRKLIGLAPVMSLIDDRFGAADSTLTKKDDLIKLATAIRARIEDAAKASRLYSVTDAEVAIADLTAKPTASETPNRDKVNRLAKQLREVADLLGEAIVKMRGEGADNSTDDDVKIVNTVCKVLSAQGFKPAKDRGDDSDAFPWATAKPADNATPSKVPATPVTVPAAGGQVVKPAKPRKPAKDATDETGDMLT